MKVHNIILLMCFVFMFNCAKKDGKDSISEYSYKLAEMKSFAETNWENRCASLYLFMKSFVANYMDNDVVLSELTPCEEESVKDQVYYEQYFNLTELETSIDLRIEIYASYNGNQSSLKKVDVDQSPEAFNKDDLLVFPNLSLAEHALYDWSKFPIETNIHAKIFDMTPVEYEEFILGDIGDTREILNDPKLIISRGDRLNLDSNNSTITPYNGIISVDEIDERWFDLENGFLDCKVIECVQNAKITYGFVGQYLYLTRTIGESSETGMIFKGIIAQDGTGLLERKL